jgi:hypothetical protein
MVLTNVHEFDAIVLDGLEGELHVFQVLVVVDGLGDFPDPFVLQNF